MWYYRLPEWTDAVDNEYLDFREQEISSWKMALKETLVGHWFFDFVARLDAIREVYNFACQDKIGKVSQPMYEEIIIRKEILEEAAGGTILGGDK